MRPRAYHDLWSLAVELAPSTSMGTRHAPTSTIDCTAVGLILRPAEGPVMYDATPVNADTFAETGGDGVHYSLLLLSDRSPDDYPVVMTVPMAESVNFVVGSNFMDFLGLGCRYGYFSLEQLAYDRDDTIAAIQSGMHANSDFHADDGVLRVVRDHFGLRPWPDVRGRLDQLHREFHPFIRLR